MEVDLKCKICDEECKNIRALVGHVRVHHGMESKEYYDKFYKTATDGICETCGKPTRFFRISQGGYFRFCSKACSNKSSLTQARKVETNMKLYGTKTSSQNAEVKEKARQTCQERYGTDSSAQSETVKETVRRNTQEKYGVDSVNSLSWKIEKTKASCREKYGVDSNFQLESNKEKSRATCMERYGTDIASKCDAVKEKMRKTNEAKYGVPSPGQNEEIKHRIITGIKNTLHDKYEQIYKEKIPNIIDYGDNTISYKCNKCNSVVTITKSLFFNRLSHNIDLCTNCIPINAPVSGGEKEIADFIRSIYDGRVVENDRTVLDGKELDIYVPGKRLAIEFDGVYWHSELYKPDDYHLKKTEGCEGKNIRLIHIFEDEWRDKPEIVKSVIGAALGLAERVQARKCTVGEVTAGEARSFLDGNHLQGSVNSKYRYGLYYNKELVALMTFGKSRFGGGTELQRYCCKLGTEVIGGASRLFGRFVKEHPEISEIISYSDRRVFGGGMYGKLGFTDDGYSLPSYYYVVDGTRHNRMEFQKHRLVAEGYDPEMTEHEIMLSREIYRIYDCGTYRYVWKRVALL